ncbi:hypothetical protein [uncultured Alsobacter sp.]|uniref:hypothetical protein n=1 Tax=uncultured Alsobacter sp. TaxID=1748258 RepID=UPI0025DC536E|nr:hypothetical protein [uncultured Alsobacter sp.]
MTVRNHNNRSEKQKGHQPLDMTGQENPASQGHQGRERGGTQDRSGTDERHDGRGRQNGGGDGAGGAPKVQGQGGHHGHQNRGHGGHS